MPTVQIATLKVRTQQPTKSFISPRCTGNLAYEIALEELGHHLDAILVDSTGDEGEAFRHGVLGGVNMQPRQAATSAETQLLEIDGEVKEVECYREA